MNKACCVVLGLLAVAGCKEAPAPPEQAAAPVCAEIDIAMTKGQVYQRLGRPSEVDITGFGEVPQSSETWRCESYRLVVQFENRRVKSKRIAVDIVNLSQ